MVLSFVMDSRVLSSVRTGTLPHHPYPALPRIVPRHLRPPASAFRPRSPAKPAVLYEYTVFLRILQLSDLGFCAFCSFLPRSLETHEIKRNFAPDQSTRFFMLRAGRIESLTVSRISDHGLYLADEEQQEVLLPNRYTSLSDKVGDKKEVFIYHDSEDRLVATTETPLLLVGQAGFLRVVDKPRTGHSSTGASTARISSSRTETSRAASSSDTPIWSTSTKMLSPAVASPPKSSRPMSTTISSRSNPAKRSTCSSPRRAKSDSASSSTTATGG